VEVLSSRVLLHPSDLERSQRFYAQTLGLSIYREWGEGDAHGVVFFLGGGFLEVSRRSDGWTTEALELWLQVRDVHAVHDELRARGIAIAEAPARRPWGLVEMAIHDPDGLRIVVVEVPDDHPLRRRT
jgi:catechol 2,3-dioxygenase-like lactoylglutathione lyase family enzyme